MWIIINIFKQKFAIYTDSSNEVWGFDPSTGVWEQGSSMAFDRERHTCVYLPNEDQVLVCGCDHYYDLATYPRGTKCSSTCEYRNSNIHASWTTISVPDDICVVYAGGVVHKV